MERFDQEEHEANDLTPHHLFAQQRAERAKRIHDITTREMMDQAIEQNYQLLDEMEVGMNLGAFPFWYRPCNLLK